MIKFDVNSDKSVVLANRLEKLHRSDLPLAVRGTLNSAAFDVKTKTMPASVNQNFTVRNKTFFRARSKVVKADGWDINNMRSMTGFVGNDQSIENLEKQEHGGNIGGRAFVPTNRSRVGSKYGRNIRKKNRLGTGKVINARKMRGNERSQFVQAYKKASPGDFILADYNGNSLLWRVNAKSVSKKGKYKITPVFSYKKGRKIPVKATNFMSEAQAKTRVKLPNFFMKEANRRFAKRMKI